MKLTKKTTQTENKNKKVALYLRANNVEVIVRQLFQALTFANKNMLSVSPNLIYADICNGNAFPRPAFEKLLREKYSTGIDTVLITSPERLGRNLDVACSSNLLLIEHNLKLNVMSE